MTPGIKPDASISSTAARFRREAQRWDQIYSGQGRLVSRLRDRLTRSSVRRRFRRTFELAGDLTGMSVLDVGCGSGRYLIEAVNAGARRAVGIDIAPEMLEMARHLGEKAAGGERIELRLADLSTLDLTERFDLVIAMGIFDYVDSPITLLAHAARLTRGLLVASFPARHAPRAMPRFIYWRARGLHIQLFDRGTVKELANRVGFTDPVIEKIGPTYILVGRRH